MKRVKTRVVGWLTSQWLHSSKQASKQARKEGRKESRLVHASRSLRALGSNNVRKEWDHSYCHMISVGIPISSSGTLNGACVHARTNPVLVLVPLIKLTNITVKSVIQSTTKDPLMSWAIEDQRTAVLNSCKGRVPLSFLKNVLKNSRVWHNWSVSKNRPK